jgi:hypothetical protein
MAFGYATTLRGSAGDVNRFFGLNKKKLTGLCSPEDKKVGIPRIPCHEFLIKASIIELKTSLLGPPQDVPAVVDIGLNFIPCQRGPDLVFKLFFKVVHAVAFRCASSAICP